MQPYVTSGLGGIIQWRQGASSAPLPPLGTVIRPEYGYIAAAQSPRRWRSYGAAAALNASIAITLDDVSVSSSGTLGQSLPLNASVSITLDDTLVASSSTAQSASARIYAMGIVLESPANVSDLSLTGGNYVNSGSTAYLAVTFSDLNGDPVAASDVKYRIDNLSDGTAIKTLTDAGSGSTLEITLKPSDNEMVNPLSPTERHRVSIVANYGTDDAFTYDIVLTVNNIGL